MEGGTYHVPVMLEPCLMGLGLDPDATYEQPRNYVDATFGGGGHSQAILDRMGENDRLWAFDQDPDALANALDDERFTLIPQNFRYARNFLRMHGVQEVHALLADLGVSSHQFDAPERGFSIRSDAPLDLRMNPKAGKSGADWLAEASIAEMTQAFRLYGELKRPDKAAWAIDKARQQEAIKTTGQLKDALHSLAPRGKENKFFAQVFQAIRIELNDELGALRELLKQCTTLMPPEGRLVVMSYHSLEDRLVKHFMRAGNFEDHVERDMRGAMLAPFKPLNRKAIMAEEQEQKENPRSRSARLRVAFRTDLPAES
jgi:16S rRNA (cytosine1402-N4)-methyltransferase